MMWEVATQPADWLKISTLKPQQVLDEYDGPRLFTVLTDDQKLLLAYQCGEDRSTSRFLLVPADQSLIADIENNAVTLRDALTKRGWAWLVDRARSGSLSIPAFVNPAELPRTALPKPGVRLTTRDVLLRLRMIGRDLGPGRVPASVVKKAVDGAMGAIRVLSAHALSMAPLAGRPAEEFRRYYDLPAVEFGFQSFEIAFGPPEIAPELKLEDATTLQKIGKLLSKGLSWASDGSDSGVEPTAEWASIVDALSKLTPPQRGAVESVEVSGRLIRPELTIARLTRASSEKVNAIRRALVPEERSQTYTGFVRELDKDKLTFFLRDSKAINIVHVVFNEGQFADVALAFETDRLVTVVVFEAVPPHELISITFSTLSDPQLTPGTILPDNSDTK